MTKNFVYITISNMLKYFPYRLGCVQNQSSPDRAYRFLPVRICLLRFWIFSLLMILSAKNSTRPIPPNKTNVNGHALRTVSMRATSKKEATAIILFLMLISFKISPPKKQFWQLRFRKRQELLCFHGSLRLIRRTNC